MRKESVVVLMTAPNISVARRLAKALVVERLAACVNILGRGRSIYRWEGKVEDTLEQFLLAKTTRACLPVFTKRVKTLHPYAVPEILALSVSGGSGSYLSWISDSVKKGNGSGPSPCPLPRGEGKSLFSFPSWGKVARRGHSRPRAG